jgi:hypothetical protein
MCDRCEDKAREHVEHAIRLLGHDMSLIAPMVRKDLEEGTDSDADVDNFFINAAMARLAMAVAMRTHQPPFIVMGEIAGAMMESQMVTEAMHEMHESITNMTRHSQN